LKINIPQPVDRFTGELLTPAQIEARKAMLADRYDRAMKERVDGGEHTGEIQEHSPWSLAISYFGQTSKG